MLGETDRCFLCGSYTGLETHHIFGGPNRHLADKDGLTVRLCWQCHREVHVNSGMMRYLHEVGQEAWEEHGTRDEFIKRYGRNYLG